MRGCPDPGCPPTGPDIRPNSSGSSQSDWDGPPSPLPASWRSPRNSAAHGNWWSPTGCAVARSSGFTLTRARSKAPLGETDREPRPPFPGRAESTPWDPAACSTAWSWKPASCSGNATSRPKTRPVVCGGGAALPRCWSMTWWWSTREARPIVPWPPTANWAASRSGPPETPSLPTPPRPCSPCWAGLRSSW